MTSHEALAILADVTKHLNSYADVLENSELMGHIGSSMEADRVDDLVTMVDEIRIAIENNTLKL